MTHPPFSHIMVTEKNDLKFSAKLVYSFLCKEFITRKKHEKWFTFARRPLRFFGLVKRKDDLGFWSKLLKRCEKIKLKMIKYKYLKESMSWTWLDRLRLVYLCVIMGVVMERDEKVNFPYLYIKLAMDFEKLQKYMWLRHDVVIGHDVQNILMKTSLRWSGPSATEFVRKDERKDERVDRILDMVRRKHNWSNHVWGVVEAISSKMDESDEEEEENEAETEIGASSHVVEDVDGMANVSVRNKRKNVDRGAKSRKKKLLCQLVA
ncbi:hypothetical protein N665_0213s0020 [Sinapis alba]|nr:hypothetical protein N665_0213s0020 [Sinapis alba]